ncbi:MAG: hypothetical protein MI741_07840 [Rhodospirillales bacterium]|nr:hypothetical protein [Rhodospirillales bacterium]
MFLSVRKSCLAVSFARRDSSLWWLLSDAAEALFRLGKYFQATESIGKSFATMRPRIYQSETNRIFRPAPADRRAESVASTEYKELRI